MFQLVSLYIYSAERIPNTSQSPYCVSLRRHLGHFKVHVNIKFCSCSHCMWSWPRIVKSLNSIAAHIACGPGGRIIKSLRVIIINDTSISYFRSSIVILKDYMHTHSLTQTIPFGGCRLQSNKLDKPVLSVVCKLTYMKQF